MRTEAVIPDVENFSFDDLPEDFLYYVGVLPSGGDKAVKLCRYSPHREAFVPADNWTLLSTVDISEAGDYLVYRVEGLSDEDCEDLDNRLALVHSSSKCFRMCSFLSP